MIPHRLSFFCLLLFGLFASGCDRAFSDVGAATIEVVSPDIQVALTEPTLNLELRVESVREVTQVRWQDTEFGRGTGTDLWQATLPLEKGLNQFVIETVVDDGPSAIDTVSVFHLTFELSQASSPVLTFGAGGHTVSPLPNGDLLLVGGSFLVGNVSGLDAHRLPSGESSFRPERGLPVFGRVGHTTTVLPDGRLLILGGADVGNIQTVDDLHEAVEVFDPSTDTFKQIPVSGPPIRRTYHSAILRVVQDRTFVVVFGGRGDTRYSPNPVLGIRQDMRTFQLRNDSLFALSPSIGPFIDLMAGHTQTPLTQEEPGTAHTFLISGMRFGTSLEAASIWIDFEGAFGIDIVPGNSMLTPRIRHASILLEDGFIAHFGGRGSDPETVFDRGELYVEAIDQYFYLPFTLAPRYGLRANRLPDGRILVLGGFDEFGTATSTAEFISLDVQ